MIIPFSRKYLILFWLLVSILVVKAQEKDTIAAIDFSFQEKATAKSPLITIPLFDIGSRIESSGLFSGDDNAPFWLTNNKYGLGSIKNNSQYIRTTGWAGFNINQPDIKLKRIYIAADLVVARNLNSTFHFQQLYIDVDYRKLRLSVGSKERNSLFKNDELSTGGLTLSSNARPVPQVELSFPDFVAVPYSKKALQVMAGISYGWYNDNKFRLNNSEDGYYAKNVLYHRKYGFLKYETKTNWNVIFGLEMDTQWGGQFYKKGEYWGNSPAKLTDFFRVLIPMQGGQSSNMTDKVNIAGNIYGSSHFIFNYNEKNYSLKAYHEHFFEDHSGLFFKNIPDGLYGIELNLKKKGLLSGVLFEYLHTKNQSGAFLWDKNDAISTQVSGGDNYYNHIDYISLSNYGFVTGNPLLTSPIYNSGNSLMVPNSRISAFHGGVNGYLSKELRYRTLISYSRSWGTPLLPSRSIRNQLSGLIEATYATPKTKGWLFSGALAFDKSTMIGDNWGIQFKVSKTIRVE